MSFDAKRKGNRLGKLRKQDTHMRKKVRRESLQAKNESLDLAVCIIPYIDLTASLPMSVPPEHGATSYCWVRELTTMNFSMSIGALWPSVALLVEVRIISQARKKPPVQASLAADHRSPSTASRKTPMQHILWVLLVDL